MGTGRFSSSLEPISARVSVRAPTVTGRACAIPAESTTYTRKPSPSGTSASSGTVTALAWAPVTIRPNTDSPSRSGRADESFGLARGRARIPTARVAESTATATLTTVADPSDSLCRPSPLLSASVSPT